ncbi:MAG: RND transporter MFP subunit [Oscillospiraceae bacterium]|nr:RND transporter MFP subunit [Oscillospiraceae bacterium]
MKAKQILSALLSLALCLGLCACQQEELESVPVQSVGMITGMGSVGSAERFSGMVEAGETVNVEKDEWLKIQEMMVAVGDHVEEGQTLFTYDTSAMSLELDKLRLELAQMKSAKETKTHQLEELEKEKAKAKTEDQLGYTLQIQELQIDLTEADMNIASKEKEISRNETALEKDKVLSPVSGRVKTINENGQTDDYGRPQAYMVLQQTEVFRIKGNINEQNAASLTPGMPVTIRSRMDDSCWTGVIESIDWENPVENNNNDYYYYSGSGGNEMSTSTKYPFYVTLDSDEGLKLGQHVYIEPGLPVESDGRLMLPAWCINDANGEKPWVWAVDGKEKLEKRELKLGEYDAENDSYEVLDGISMSDYLAPDSETCQEGAPVVYYSESDFGSSNFFGADEFGFEGEYGFEDGEYGFEEGENGFEGEEYGVEDGTFIPEDGEMEGETAPTEGEHAG